MVDQILGDKADPFLGADDRLKLRPLGLQPLLVFDFFAFGGFLEFLVKLRLFGLVEFQLRQAALVVDRNRRAVLHGPLNVIDADIVAEHGAGVLVRQFDRRTVKPMNDAFGNASRMCRAKPSMKSYWLRWASSAITTMFRRSDSNGCWSSPSVGKNF